MTQQDVAEAYAKYGHLVYRRCQRILRHDAEAEDALQEVFTRLWRYGDAFGQADSKLLWLYWVAERCCFDALSRRRRREERSLDSAPPPISNSTAQAFEDRDLVIRFLGRFDDRLKQVAILHYLDEMTQEEIAIATGWSRQTISKKLAFLRQRAAILRARLCTAG